MHIIITDKSRTKLKIVVPLVKLITLTLFLAVFSKRTSKKLLLNILPKNSIIYEPNNMPTRDIAFKNYSLSLIFISVSNRNPKNITAAECIPMATK